MKPFHSLEEFIDACERNEVVLWPCVVGDATRDFNLYTQKEVVEFIVNNEFTFINSKELEAIKNVPSFMVDAYSFCSGKKSGYMAFFKHKNGKFFIKSFKLNNSSKIGTKQTASTVKNILSQIKMKKY